MLKPDPTKTGLIKKHAYSITGIKCIPLIRLRNPWGNGDEWNGCWSDK